MLRNYPRIIDCFKNIIGIKNPCDLEAQDIYQYYINDLPGMSIEFGDDLSNSETITSAMDFYQKIINFSIKQVCEDTLTALNQKAMWRPNVAATFERVGYERDKWLAPSASTMKRGIRLYNHYEDPNRNLYIKEIELNWNNTINASLFIKDGTYLKQFDFFHIAGKKTTLQLNYQCNTREVFIYVEDQYQISPLQIDRYYHSCHCNIDDSWFGRRPYSEYVEVNRWDELAIPSLSSTDLFGMKVSYTLECDFTHFFCTMAPYMGDVLLYRTGIEILLHGRYVNRMNGSTIGIIADERDTENNLSKQLKKIYEQKMDNLVKSIDGMASTIAPRCFRCQQARNEFLVI